MGANSCLVAASISLKGNPGHPQSGNVLSTWPSKEVHLRQIDFVVIQNCT